jgi:hypothetical protein
MSADAFSVIFPVHENAPSRPLLFVKLAFGDAWNLEVAVIRSAVK